MAITSEVCLVFASHLQAEDLKSDRPTEPDVQLP